MCGGSTAADPLNVANPGLSPRVRGKPPTANCCAGDARSIPACAGEAGRHGKPFGLGEVYPRVCGGSKSGMEAIAKAEGLSPRVRGKHCGLRSADTPARSIPACAGEA